MPQRCTFLINKRNSRSSPAVTLIVQASLDLGCIPFSWKRHWSSRYFRKGIWGIKQSPFLTTILCKMCEHIVHCTANIGHLSAHDTLTNSQHGFCKRSCDTQFIRTIHDLVIGSEKKEHTDPILFDSAKAFDNLKVTSCLLQHQIEHYGVRCHTLHQVKVTLATSGISQGSATVDHCFSWYSSMIYQPLLDTQAEDSLQMTVYPTSKLHLPETLSNFKTMSMPFRNGNRLGWCSSILWRVKAFVSPANRNLSLPLN